MTLFPTITPGAPTTGVLPVSTPLGDVTFGILLNDVLLDLTAATAYCLPHGGQFLQWTTPYGQLEAVHCRPALIPAYWDTITDCWAILWRVRAALPLTRLQFSSLWHPANTSYTGGPTSGELQETQTWDDTKWVLSLGTEGEDGLYQRATHNNGLPSRLLTAALPEWEILPLVHYLPLGLRLDLPAIEVGECIQAQFAVAWAPYTADAISTWNAVCILERHILAGAQGSHIWNNENDHHARI